jgi:hypothetical protein
MTKSYSELNLMPAKSFLNPSLFETGYDSLPSHSEENKSRKYAYGLAIANEYEEVGVSCNGTWYASSPLKQLSSYEGIGYHALTSQLLAGLLAGKARVVIYRYSDNGVTRTVIKETTE